MKLRLSESVTSEHILNFTIFVTKRMFKDLYCTSDLDAVLYLYFHVDPDSVYASNPGQGTAAHFLSQSYNHIYYNYDYDYPTANYNYEYPTANYNYDYPTAVYNYDYPTAIYNYDYPTANYNYDYPTANYNYDYPTAI
nr:hypothetical protein BaRGS_019958 [Batillaria attramentaria]